MALFPMAFLRLFALVFRHFVSPGVIWAFCFFAWPFYVFLSFCLALFRVFAWPYYGFSFFRLAFFLFFRLFAWRYFVFSPRHNARRKDEKRNH